MHATPAGALAAARGDGAAETARPPVLGLDIGGTKLAAGVVDGTGVVHAFGVEPTAAERGPADGVARLFELGHRVAAASGVAWAEVAAVGICCGGPLDRKRGVLIAPLHLPDWVDVPLTALPTGLGH